MKLKSITGSLLAVGALLVANPASANLDFIGAFINDQGDVSYDADFVRGTLTCDSDPNCEGLLSTLPDHDAPPDADQTRPDATDANGFSTDDASLFVLPNSGLDTEAAFLSAVLGITVEGEDLDQVDNPGGEGATDFCVTSEYILFKIGQSPDYALVHNTAGGEFCFDYAVAAGSGEGGGLSHVTIFETDGRVSEPSILALFGAGLLLLGFLRRRTIV
jgi:hypothetical protein